MDAKQDFIPTLEFSQTTPPKDSPVGNRTRNMLALKDKVVGQHTAKLQAALEKKIGLPPSSNQSGVVSSPLATYCNSTPLKITTPVTETPDDDKPTFAKLKIGWLVGCLRFNVARAIFG
ncbi:hypothetical protein AVEN_64619-1 [Araneus ventricosus]|uniref:Uncharacterized protein n=1 Tax=Araneus ventricosus TaxID=182803 RepID=A0A4Y1ZPL9_ARAVE|nr:hypothetical protein AVEN_64619-1 [Araneus ventricosus]